MSISMEIPSSWDALRKQARKLEAQLDEQMNSFRKLVSTKGSTNVETADSDLESGIERLLKQLQQVNSQMQAWVSSGGSEMVSHTLTRHQEILQDLTQEFYRLRSSLRAKQEHASLLDDFREFDRSRLELEDGLGTAEQTLLKEHATIGRSTGQMDNVISQAQATLGALVFQRSTFGGINSKLSNVSSRLPSVNHILAAIKRKKSMDTIILSLVASICTFLIFIYWLTKKNETAYRWTKKIGAGMEEDDDPWLAPDKLYHFLLCFSLTILFASFALHTRYPFIRRHSILIGSVLSLCAGAAKEVADELGFFKSAGASTRDAVADLIGVLLASFLLHALRFSIRSSGGDKEACPNRDILMV